MEKLYLGVDLHKRSCWVIVLSQVTSGRRRPALQLVFSYRRYSSFLADFSMTSGARTPARSCREGLSSATFGRKIAGFMRIRAHHSPPKSYLSRFFSIRSQVKTRISFVFMHILGFGARSKNLPLVFNEILGLSLIF